MKTLIIKAKPEMIEGLEDLIKYNSEFLIDMLSDTYQFSRNKAQRLVDSIEMKVE